MNCCEILLSSQGVSNLFDSAQIVILNDNLSGIGIFDQALIVLYGGVYENNLLSHG